MKNFKDKVAAITGAASGMGRTLAIELARRGCHLALSDVNQTGLDETAQMAKVHGVKVTTCLLDVSQRDAVYAWADQVAADHGKVNLIFNNAGVALSVHMDVIQAHDFEWIMGINFWGVVYGTQAFLPYLKLAKEGHVINISSVFGIFSVPTQGAYNATKFAVRGYTESLRMELDLANCGVSATCIHPGGVATNIAKTSRFDPSMESRTGASIEAQRKHGDKFLQNSTSPESAALQILKGVENNSRRVLIGKDAVAFDLMARVLGSWYQILVGKAYKKMSKVR